jgi:hypothetical protein
METCWTFLLKRRGLVKWTIGTDRGRSERLSGYLAITVFSEISAIAYLTNPMGLSKKVQQVSIFSKKFLVRFGSVDLFLVILGKLLDFLTETSRTR